MAKQDGIAVRLRALAAPARGQRSCCIAGELRAVKKANLAGLDSLIREETGFSADFLRFYYTTALRFDFGAREKQGLRLFWELCVKHSLLKPRPGDLRTI